MNRKRLALILFVPTVLLVLLVGLTRGTNEDTDSDDDPSDDRELVAVAGDAAVEQAVLEKSGELIPVPEGSDCTATTVDTTPTCQAYVARGVEVGWLVEENVAGPLAASFLVRSSPTEWTRVLESQGTWDSVNVRLDDVTGDGAIEAVFAFHTGRSIVIDAVDSTGTVILHVDVGDGEVNVASGVLTIWQREGERWRKRELQLDGVDVEITSEELVEGPAQGNV